MKISQIKPGKKLPPSDCDRIHFDGFESLYNYTHVLPRNLKKEGYLLVVGQSYRGRADWVTARVFHRNEKTDGKMTCLGKVGALKASFNSCLIESSYILPRHSGKSLGMWSYVAVYVHMYHNMNIRTVMGDTHSSLACRTHQKICARFGLKGYYYNKKDTSNGYPNDCRFGDYEYDLN